MRTTLLTFFFLLFCGTVAQAQVTLTQSGLPSPGQRVWLTTADSLAGLDLSQTGTNFTWDFSQMGAITQRKDTFISYSTISLLLRLLFPTNTNVVRFIQTPDSIGGLALSDAYEFLHKSAGAYRSYGIGSFFQGFPVTFVNSPADTVLSLPLDYGDTDSVSFQAVLSIPGIAYYRQRRQRASEVDGWGTVETPYASYSALRLRATTYGQDSVAIAFDSTLNFSGNLPVTRAYQWWSPQEPVPVLTVNTLIQDSLGIEAVTGIVFVDSFRPGLVPLSIARPAVDPLGMYPNPASDRIHLDLPQGWVKGQLTVTDLQGRTLITAPWTPDFRTLDLSALPAGSYSVKLETSNAVCIGKLLIQR